MRMGVRALRQRLLKLARFWLACIRFRVVSGLIWKKSRMGVTRSWCWPVLQVWTLKLGFCLKWRMRGKFDGFGAGTENE